LVHGITVIIPAFNAEKFILGALESLKEQLFQPTKVIVVDDGSSDKTVALINEWVESNNLQFDLEIISKGNGGLSSARNAGIQAAATPLIALLDADDKYHSKLLSTAVSAFQSNASIALFFANQRVINSCGDKIQEWLTIKAITKLKQKTLCDDIKILEEELLPSLAFGNFISCSASVMNREAVLASGLFNEKIMAGEDLDFFVRFLPSKKVAFTYEELADVLRHPSSISQNKSRYVNINAVRVLLDNKAKFQSKKFNIDEIINHRLQDCFYNASLNGFKELVKFSKEVGSINPNIKPLSKDWLRAIYYTFK